MFEYNWFEGGLSLTDSAFIWKVLDSWTAEGFRARKEALAVTAKEVGS